MLKNYFQIAIRNLYRNLLTSLINVIGLGLAIGSCIPFFHIIRYETSFDHFHERADRIYRVILDWSERDDSGQVHYPAAEALQSDFPDFERIARVHGPVFGKISIELNEKHDLFEEGQILYADQDFFRTFDFSYITPITSSTLQNPNEVLLTASLSKKYFSDLDPIGKTIFLNDSTPLQVVGLLEDPPLNTNTPFRMIISLATFDLENIEREGWLFTGDETVYVTLKQRDYPEKFRQRLEDFTKQHVAFYKEGMYFYRLQPLKEVHTSVGFGWDKNYHTPPEVIWLPAFMGLLIIVIASINYVNLATAQVLTLTKETGIRKMIGSSKIQLLLRFLLQTFIIVFISLIVGLILGYGFLMSVNQLFAIVNYNLSIDMSTFVFLFFIGLTVLLLAGLYPALVLINFKPANAFRGTFVSSRKYSFTNLRKCLVIFQITSSLVLLVATIVITAQIDFWTSVDLKFRTKDIITFTVPASRSLEKRYLKNLLENSSGVQLISYSSFSPLLGAPGGASLSGTDTNVDVGINFVDENFQDVYGLKLVAGKSVFSHTQPSLFINERLAQLLGFSNAEDALGINIDLTILLGKGLTGPISGVYRDFINDNPMDATINPYVMLFNLEKANRVNVALIQNSSPETMNYIKAAFKQIFPNEIFAADLLTAQIEANYIVESLMQKTVRFISCISIGISAIGIVGIINFIIIRRRKEFGVRKVVGADRGDIIKIFLTEFIILTIISFLIGGPVAVWLLQKWLQNYPNHIALSPGYFLVAFAVIIIVVVLITLVQVRRISKVSPAEILRSE